MLFSMSTVMLLHTDLLVNSDKKYSKKWSWGGGIIHANINMIITKITNLKKKFNLKKNVWCCQPNKVKVMLIQIQRMFLVKLNGVGFKVNKICLDI